MTFKDYIKFRLSSASFKDMDSKKDILNDIYKELESKGMHHSEIFTLINEVIIEKLLKLKQDLLK